MVQLSEGEVKQLQAKGDEIVERLKSDEEFRTRLNEDPRETLVAAGLREEAIPQFLQALQPEDEVGGYVWRPPIAPEGAPEGCIPNPFPRPLPWSVRRV